MCSCAESAQEEVSALLFGGVTPVQRGCNTLAKCLILNVIFVILTYIELQVVSNRPHVDKMVDHVFLYVPLASGEVFVS